MYRNVNGIISSRSLPCITERCIRLYKQECVFDTKNPFLNGKFTQTDSSMLNKRPSDLGRYLHINRKYMSSKKKTKKKKIKHKLKEIYSLREKTDGNSDV